MTRYEALIAKADRLDRLARRLTAEGRLWMAIIWKRHAQALADMAQDLTLEEAAARHEHHR